jgi:hypothetical protein
MLCDEFLLLSLKFSDGTIWVVAAKFNLLGPFSKKRSSRLHYFFLLVDGALKLFKQ